jgi:hypothetical protein
MSKVLYKVKETLEEAAERLYPINFTIDYDTNKEERDIWLNGAKWQAERMYSEEEVIKLLIYCKDRFGGSGLEDYTSDSEVKQWFEQHKKK